MSHHFNTQIQLAQMKTQGSIKSKLLGKVLFSTCAFYIYRFDVHVMLIYIDLWVLIRFYLIYLEQGKMQNYNFVVKLPISYCCLLNKLCMLFCNMQYGNNCSSTNTTEVNNISVQKWYLTSESFYYIVNYCIILGERRIFRKQSKYPVLNKCITSINLLYFILRGRRGRDRIVVGFITTYAISAYNH